MVFKQYYVMSPSFLDMRRLAEIYRYSCLFLESILYDPKNDMY